MSTEFPAGKIPLKAFWEAVERRLMECSADDLRAILRAMAQEVRSSERAAFLARLGTGPLTVATPQTPWGDLLSDIDDLAQEIRDAMENADEWEEEHGWEDEEDILGQYIRFMEPLTALFERAGLAFDHGELVLARQAYEQLLDMTRWEDDYGRGPDLYALSLDAREAVARYLRAVYETESPEHRPAVLYDRMQAARSWLHPGGRPMLEELIQISPRPLPDQEAFLDRWIALLRTRSGPDADAWLREAVRLSEGTTGLERLARTEGRQHPRAYLDWFTALEQEGKYAAVLAAAREALETLPAGLPIRAAIADHLCQAAAALNDPRTLFQGRWEAFLAKPTLSRLLDLWEAVPEGDDRALWMRRAAGHIQTVMARPSSESFPFGFPAELDALERPVRPEAALLAHARILAGDLEEVYRAVHDKPVLGWSHASSDQALLVSFFLVLLSGQRADQLTPNLASLWSQSLGNTIDYWEKAVGLARRLEQVYADYLVQAVRSGALKMSPEQEEERLAWCLNVAQRRVEAIVGNRHRSSYGKAATLAAACAEVLWLRGDAPAARSFVAEIGGRFPRHRAFQDELRVAVQQMERALGRGKPSRAARG